MNPNRLNVRVYGLLEHNGKVLLVHEKIRDFHFTKFPGGGLELGEGTIDCVIREFKEETGIDIEVVRHFYTTDFYQQSAFRATDQLISIYYIVKALSDPALIRLEEFDIMNEGQVEQLHFFWVERGMLNEAMVTFPVDKLVIKKLAGGE